MDKPNFYGILPADVRYDKSLKPMEKILYTEITALSNKEGYCYATNSYFANLYEVHKNTVSCWINNLEKQGYIKTVLIYKKGRKEIEERRIYINTKNVLPINENIDTYQQKDCDPINKKIDTPINKKVEDNNTSINNTRYIKKENIKRKDEDELEKIIEFWNEKAKEYQIPKIKFVDEKRKKKIYQILKEFGTEQFIECIQKIGQSNFLLGKTENNRNWKVNFNFVLRTDKFIEILEDKYTDIPINDKPKIESWDWNG